MTLVPLDPQDDSSIHASGRRAVTAETARTGFGEGGTIRIKNTLRVKNAGHRIHNLSGGKV